MRDKTSNTFADLIHGLINIIISLYHLAPAVVIVGMLLTAIMILVSLAYVKIMMAIVIILVFITPTIIYFKTNNYGEASFALVAGLLAAFTVEWNQSTFITFTVVWVSFWFLILLISSVKLASKTESIYRQAAISINPNNFAEIEKQLREAAKPTPLGMIGPIERAEIVLMLAFRKIPVNMVGKSLVSIEQLVTATKLDYKVTTKFYIDFLKILETIDIPQANQFAERMFTMMRETPVSPEEFVSAFTNTRRLVLSGKIDLATYLCELKEGLSKGISPEEMHDHFSTKIS